MSSGAEAARGVPAPGAPVAAESWVCDAAAAGSRLDACLARVAGAPSATAARRWIAEGRVRVGGKPGRKGQRVSVGDRIDLVRPEAPRLAPDPALPIAVLHEDADLVAIAKPPGLASRALPRAPGPSAAAALVARFPECAGASPDPLEGGLGHRLDRGTGGVLLAARHAEAWRRLRAALASSECAKVYRAEVAGALVPEAIADGVEYARPGPVPGSLVVGAPLGRTGRRGGRVRIARGRGLMAAETQVTVVEHRAGSTLVEARLARGRPHQIRAHLAHLGFAVLGDDAYGHGGDALRLHAWRVSLPHPMTGQALVITAPLPGWARSAAERAADGIE